MNIAAAMSRCHEPKPSSPQVFLPDELIIEVLTFLPVKSLMQFRCVCHFWNALISDPTFKKNHQKKSERNKHLILISKKLPRGFFVDSLSVRRLVENPLLITLGDKHCGLRDVCLKVVGSCNGLLCLRECFPPYLENWLYFYNPATKTISEELGSFTNKYMSWFAFGYDNSTDTYKVVALCQVTSDVSVFSLGDNIWKNIQSFPEVHFPPYFCFNGGVYLSSTLNWLVLRNNIIYDRKNRKIEHYVIISLNLGTETYTQLFPPRGFDEVLLVQPTISVLMDCVCFTHDFKGIGLLIWKMMEFGVEESWTQLLKINYNNLQMYYYIHQLVPLYVSGDTLILINRLEGQPILYNLKNRVTKTIVTKGKRWFYVNNYAESLVSTDGK
ncbi:unnamed protein product [Trifolium pratense]|uniref:Uncharacterized protein n=1 Tax=Trifolium pratense TaxID=57577 RepID=A0ACB0LRF7_TRIPR|nr:unnamed protein product [Trifolium pratense]